MRLILKAHPSKCDTRLSSLLVSFEPLSINNPVTEMNQRANQSTAKQRAAVWTPARPIGAVRPAARPYAGPSRHTVSQPGIARSLCTQPTTRARCATAAQQVIPPAAAAELLRNGKSTDSIMSNCLPINDFHIARPRGKDMPSAPVPRKTTNTSSNSAFGSVKTLDRLGRHTVSLAPRVMGAISIEPREQAIASRDKRDAIKRGMSQ